MVHYTAKATELFAEQCNAPDITLFAVHKTQESGRNYRHCGKLVRLLYGFSTSWRKVSV